ncbi:MAG: D-alanyl-D-alanine carboxypeptidase [Pseudomonadota bacterium]
MVHAETGDVLFARHADAARYPASITKVMTLYMLFEAIEAGEVNLDDTFTVSKRAAGQPPSKLGVRRGEKLKVETAIEALVVRSANDVATVVAEGLAGTEYKFAIEMTKKARSIGMRRTTFKNASGLPNRYQKSTARDLATLTMRMMQDFPQYFPYFSQKSFVYKGRTYRTHNRVLLSYKGSDGLKTGYTRASGYNLSTTARRDEHRLIGIVLGGKTSRSRDNHMHQILDKSFRRVDRDPSVLRRAFVSRPAPRMKPTLMAELAKAQPQIAAASAGAKPVTVAALADVPSAASASPSNVAVLSSDPIGQLIQRTDQLHTAATAWLNEDEARIGQGDITDETSAPPLADLKSDWSVQIGAYKSAELAASKLRRVAAKTGGEIAEAPWAVAPVEKAGGLLYRARFIGFEQVDAESHCLRVKAKGLE